MKLIIVYFIAVAAIIYANKANATCNAGEMTKLLRPVDLFKLDNKGTIQPVKFMPGAEVHVIRVTKETIEIYARTEKNNISAIGKVAPKNTPTLDCQKTGTATLTHSNPPKSSAPTPN